MRTNPSQAHYKTFGCNRTVGEALSLSQKANRMVDLDSAQSRARRENFVSPERKVGLIRTNRF